MKKLIALLMTVLLMSPTVVLAHKSTSAEFHRDICKVVEKENPMKRSLACEYLIWEGVRKAGHFWIPLPKPKVIYLGEKDSAEIRAKFDPGILAFYDKHKVYILTHRDGDLSPSELIMAHEFTHAYQEIFRVPKEFVETHARDVSFDTWMYLFEDQP